MSIVNNTLHRKLKIEQNEPQYIRDEIRHSGMLDTYGTRHVTNITNQYTIYILRRTIVSATNGTYL